jgi:hypothetical protein
MTVSLPGLTVERLQQRDGGCMVADLIGKGGRVWTVPVRPFSAAHIIVLIVFAPTLSSTTAIAPSKKLFEICVNLPAMIRRYDVTTDRAGSFLIGTVSRDCDSLYFRSLATFGADGIM